MLLTPAKNAEKKCLDIFSGWHLSNMHGCDKICDGRLQSRRGNPTIYESVLVQLVVGLTWPCQRFCIAGGASFSQ